MKSKTCSQRMGNRHLDSRTSEIIRKFRLQAEGLALELAVRLRVLGKTLHAACPEQRTECDPATYNELRGQLDAFFASVDKRPCAAQRHVVFIRNYLQKTLPARLKDCPGKSPCLIDLLDEIIERLTEVAWDEDGFGESLAVSCSW